MPQTMFGAFFFKHLFRMPFPNVQVPEAWPVVVSGNLHRQDDLPAALHYAASTQ